MNSKIIPQIYASMGLKFYFDNHFSLVPSLNMHTSFSYLPVFQGNLMLNYRTRFGIGATVTGKDFIGAIFQVRFLKNANLGIAYEYSINRMLVAPPNTLEVMLGIIPIFEEKNRYGKSNNMAKCPILEF